MIESADRLPGGFRSDLVVCNGVSLHVVHNGHSVPGEGDRQERPPLLLLHGFPEFWMGWEGVGAQLADDYFVVMPDQRGCNKSEAPAGVEQYAAWRLVGDMVELAQLMFGNRPINLVGHDFGASIGYAMAFAVPDLISRFAVVNGAHPVCFQEALIDNPDQAAASEYFHTVRRRGAGLAAAADGFAGLFGSIEGHSTQRWLTEDIRRRFREAWEGPERVEAMFNWYRASPIVVPEAGAPLPDAPLYGASPDAFRVTMPHLVVWGVDDTALLPDSRARLPAFCDDLTIHEIAGADHWIVHTHPEVVAEHIRQFVRAES